MKRTSIPVDNSLLISRFQQKELYQSAPGTSNVSPTMTQLPSHTINPFFDPIALKIGLKFKLLGSKIINCSIERGYLSHGLEHIIAGNNFIEGIKNSARINQRIPIFYQLALILAYENLFSIKVEPKIQVSRAIALEIARIYHLFCVMKDMFVSLNADTLFELARSGKNAIKIPARYFCSVNNPLVGNNKIDSNELIEICDIIIQIIDDMDTCSEYETILVPLLKRKALINLSMASSMGLTGSYIRANRCVYDLRTNSNPSINYINSPKINILEGGDALARLKLRMRDIQSSASWLKDRLTQFVSDGHEIHPLYEDKILTLEEATKTFAFGEIEGPEGDIKAALFVDNNNLIFHLRTPAYFIAQAIPHIILYADLADLPLLLGSLGITAEEIDK